MKPLDRAARPSAPEFDVHLTESVMVPMRDGVRMATDIYCPARDGRPLSDRRPVLLHRTPYNKTETEATMGQCDLGAVQSILVAGCTILTQQHGEVDRVLRVSRATIGPGEQLQDREPG